MATGVLVVGVNRATRLLGHLMLTEKAYDATVRLGVTTTTDDAEGEVVATTATDGLDESPRPRGVREPSPARSTRCPVRCRRSRSTASGPTSGCARASRSSWPHAASPSTSSPSARCAATRSTSPCGAPAAPTSARSHATPAQRLGVGGHLTALRRTAVGPFDLAAARTLDELGETFVLTPITVAARAAFPAYDLDERQAADVRVGRVLDAALPTTGPVAVFAPDGEFLALYEQAGEQARAVAVFTG